MSDTDKVHVCRYLKCIERPVSWRIAADKRMCQLKHQELKHWTNNSICKQSLPGGL